ncbi:MAG TPA: NUDIX domain-containing protein, partial [Actinomycetaceae bacterium]|nr:NUDIX domain-containing protein [Actinomycetaceae bacterium]
PALVVAAAIIADGRLLAAERSSPPALAGQWELPGGKVENGEEPVAALRREIREELGVELVIGGRVPAPDGGDWPVLGGHLMRVWRCELAVGQPEPLQDHSRLSWVPLDRPESVSWLGPDLPIVEEIGVRESAGRQSSL